RRLQPHSPNPAMMVRTAASGPIGEGTASPVRGSTVTPGIPDAVVPMMAASGADTVTPATGGDAVTPANSGWSSETAISSAIGACSGVAATAGPGALPNWIG